MTPSAMARAVFRGSGEAENSTLEAALAYARQGLRIVELHAVVNGKCTCQAWRDKEGKGPCPGPGKHPRRNNWQDAATTHENDIRRMFRRKSNLGIATGNKSGIFVLDKDPRNGGDESFEDLIGKYGAPPETLQVTTGSGGEHYYFRHPGGVVPCLSSFLPGLDVKGDGGQVVAPPSVTDKGPYIWDGIAGFDDPIADAPEWLLDLIRGGSGGNGKRRPEQIPEVIPDGKKHATCVSLAGSMRRRGCNADEIFAALVALSKRFESPVPHENLKQIAEDVEGRYRPDERIIRTFGTKPVGPVALDDVIATFRRWLYLPDPAALIAVLSAYAANRMNGDPVWLLLVGPPGSGKTEIINPLCSLPDVHSAATITEAGLLSGTPKKDRSSESSGGLLRAVGPFGYIVAKDFTSVLAMNRDSRAAMLAALREVYDGSWTRHVGTDGGRALSWAGKCALIAGCTPVIDQHHAVMSSMGERFLLFRLPEVDGDELAMRALSHPGAERRMRDDFAGAVYSFFASLAIPAAPPELTQDEKLWLVALTTLAVRCRSSVERDSYSREIDLVPDAEAPGRLARALSLLMGGAKVIGCDAATRNRIVRKVALDCVPAVRRTVFEYLAGCTDTASTTDVATAIDYPTTTARRALEELAAHRVVVRVKLGKGNTDLWHVSAWTRERLAFIEKVFPKSTEEDN